MKMTCKLPGKHSVAIRRKTVFIKMRSVSRTARTRAVTWDMRRSLFSAPSIQHQPVKPQALQYDLLTGTLVDYNEFRVKLKYSRRKKSRAEKKKVVQYKMRYWQGVKGVRKIARRSRLYEDQANDVNVIDWSASSYTAFLINMLDYIPREIAELAQVSSNRIAEIVTWINRKWCDEPFSFDECCRAISVNPEEKREQLLETIEELFGSRFDHYRILRNSIIDAESGDSRAIDWVLSQSNVRYTFNDCCRALGFKPDKARAEVILPAGYIAQDQSEDCIDPRNEPCSMETLDMFAIESANVSEATNVNSFDSHQV